MSINSINMLHIVSLVVTIVSVIFLIIAFCSKSFIVQSDSGNKKSIVGITLTLFLVCSIVFSQIPNVLVFKTTNDLKNTFDKVTISNIKLDLFEYAPYEEINVTDRRILLKENEGTHIFCIIQPKNTYINQIQESAGCFHKFKEKLYSRNLGNKYGKIVISPIYLDRIYGLFVESFYGYIIIPIGDDYDLILEYRSDSNLTECKTEIYSMLNSICKDNAH